MTTPDQPRRYGPPGMPALTDLPWAVALNADSAGGSRLLTSNAVAVIGWQFGELSGTQGSSAYLYEGRNSSGNRILPILMQSTGNNVAGPGWPGFPVRDGLYMVVNFGSFAGSIWVVPLIGGV